MAQKSPLEDIAPEDVAEFASHGPGPVVRGGTLWVWRYYVRMLEQHLPVVGA